MYCQLISQPEISSKTPHLSQMYDDRSVHEDSIQRGSNAYTQLDSFQYQILLKNTKNKGFNS